MRNNCWVIFLSFLVVLSLGFFVATGQVTAAGYTVIVDGSPLNPDVEPTIVEDRMLVPFRAIFEALGGKVEWNDAARTVSGDDGASKVILTVDSHNATVNGNTVYLDVPAKIINGRVMVPIRFVAENLGGIVEWSDSGKVIVNKVTGAIQIAGSTSVQPLSEELAKAFMAKYPKVKINIAGGGSGAGIKAAAEGTSDIGASSRELTEDEQKKVKKYVIAFDGIAIIVHKDNTVGDLTKEQIKNIFAGKITNWAEVGGGSGPIRVVNREEGSGTRGAFEELIMGKETAIVSSAIVQNSTGAVRTAVSADSNAIGYISLGSLDSSVKALKVDGIEANVANIKTNTYKVYRPFIYMTRTEPVGATKYYIEWVHSPSGQAIVTSNKYISID